MKYGNLVLEKKEFVTLKRLLNLTRDHGDQTQRKSLLKLQEELKTAIVLDEDEIPSDIIRFNSVVTVESSDGWKHTFHLVSPNNSNFSDKKISVLTTMGSAVIGYAQDDIIQWEFPNGTKSLTVVLVEQQNYLMNSK
tara:strand:+ start:833884 stop:834294 length:411 start_codon:yes stop_codon:yes gene_type:complete